MDPEVATRIRLHANSARVLFREYRNEKTGLLADDLEALLADWERLRAEVRRLEGLIKAFCSAKDVDPFFSALKAISAEAERIREREARNG